MSASADDSATDKKRASGLFRWLFLLVLTLPFVSFFLGGYLRELHSEQSSDVHQCVELCGSSGIKLYDGPRKLCECSSSKESK